LHVQAAPARLSEYVPDLPDALVEIVMKVLAKEPSARYRTADQLGRVLLRFGGDSEKTPALPLLPEAGRGLRHQAPRSMESVPSAGASAPEIDWISVALGLLAVLAVGGLVPFWMWVYFAFNPPLR
jgi:serine/threonine-protein kinase